MDATSCQNIVEDLSQARSLSDLKRLMGPMTVDELHLLEEARNLEPSEDEMRVLDEDFVRRVTELTMARLNEAEGKRGPFSDRGRETARTR